MDTSSLIVRPNTSDSASFRQIFTDEELAPIQLPSDALILDCGAYVGYSSFYLLSKFPSSRVLAVEPDDENFQILGRNLRGFVGAFLAQAAVWSEETALSRNPVPFRDGREWTRSFAPYDRNQSSLACPGIPISTLMKIFSSRPVDLLKMDIEGAETLIFSPVRLRRSFLARSYLHHRNRASR